MFVLLFACLIALVVTFLFSLSLYSRVEDLTMEVERSKGSEERLVAVKTTLTTRTAEVYEAREAVALAAEQVVEMRDALQHSQQELASLVIEYQRTSNILIDIERRMGADLEAIDVKHAAEIKALKAEAVVASAALIGELEERAQDLEAATDRIVALEIELENRPLPVVVKKTKKLTLKKSTRSARA